MLLYNFERDSTITSRIFKLFSIFIIMNEHVNVMHGNSKKLSFELKHDSLNSIRSLNRVTLL
jgi:hypothetical protein